MDAGGEDGSRKRQGLEAAPHINDRETSDVVILLVETEEELNLYAHKAVLTRHSDYFRSYFSERWTQGEEQSMPTIDTTGKGGIAKYEKFFQFIYSEPITVASLDLHAILDMLEIASELSCGDIVNACDHYLACVYWPEEELIGARLTSLCDKFKCSQELGQRLVEYGHPAHLSTLTQKAVEVWRKQAHGYYSWPEAFAAFTVMVLPIVPEEFVAHEMLPLLYHGHHTSCYQKIILTILERWLSKESNASNHPVIAKELVRCTGRGKSGVGKVLEDKLNQLVRKLGEVEQWEVFAVWTEGDYGEPNLQPSWLNFRQQFCHLSTVRDAALKSWCECKDYPLKFAFLTTLLLEMMPEVLARNFGCVPENLGWAKRSAWPASRLEQEQMFTVCSDMLEQITTGKLLLDASERCTLAKHLIALMSEATHKEDIAKLAAANLIKLIKTIPAERRCDLLPDTTSIWPDIAEAFGPMHNVSN